MPSTLQLAGIDELLAALEHLAPDLAAEAAPLEQSMAEATADELRAAYPIVTGHLRATVQVARLSATTSARVATAVTAGAPYAEHVEFGTARMPGRPTFVPITRRGRQAFARTIIDRVRGRGLQVTGEVS
jgi:HK97 gp10 family phage protein